MKKGKIDQISMADGQCGYAYGGRIYNSKQFKNLYAQGGVHSDEAQDRALIAKMIAENEAQHGEKESPNDRMGDGGEKKKTFQRTGPEGYHEDVKDPKSKKIFSGGVDKKGNKTYSLTEDMTDVNIAAGGGQRNLEPTNDNTEQPQTITNPVASASDIKRAPSNTQTNISAPADGQSFTGSFSQAFGSARKSGLKTFTWNGKLFGTKLATESGQGPIASREGVISNSADKEQSTLGRKITPEAEKMYAKMYNKLPEEGSQGFAKNTSYDEFRKKKDASKKVVADAVNKRKGVAQDNTKVDVSKSVAKAGI